MKLITDYQMLGKAQVLKLSAMPGLKSESHRGVPGRWQCKIGFVMLPSVL
jgi:hypothetical protein